VTALLVTAGGGHLAELHRLAERLVGLDQDRLWVTSESEQSRSLLRDERVVFARDAAPRDAKSILANVPLARRLLSSGELDCVVSNGSGIALSFLPLADATGLPCHYIECAARTIGPSVTGRIVKALPNVSTYAQYRRWASGGWRYAGCVLDGFAPVPRAKPGRVSRVLVTVGSVFPFRRLAERLVRITPPGTELVWQLGATDVAGLPIAARPSLAPDVLARLNEQVDVVVAHAGIGCALAALDAGKRPVLAPREHRYGEHVDDHQQQLAVELAERGLAVARPVDSLTFEDLEQAAEHGVQQATPPAPVVLDEPDVLPSVVVPAATQGAARR
jgi:UDP-N-acetylglucosamine transferase subunit ALG13